MNSRLFAAALILVPALAAAQTLGEFPTDTGRFLENTGTQEFQIGRDWLERNPRPLLEAGQTYTTPVLTLDFELKNTAGQTKRAADYMGKVVLLDFFATWCPPCNASAPFIQQMHEKYKDAGLVVLGIDIKEDAEAVEAFKLEHGLTYEDLLDSDGSVTKAAGVKGVPTFMFLDEHSRIGKRFTGWTPEIRAGIEAEIRMMLNLDPQY